MPEAARPAGAGFPGAPPGGGGQGAELRFRRLRLHRHVRKRQGPKGQQLPARGSFRDIFSGIFGGRGGAAAEGPEPGIGSRIPGQRAFLDRDPRRRHAAEYHAARYLSQLPWPGIHRVGGTCPECGGKGQVTQTGGRMKFNVQCPRCHGTGKNISTCPNCHGEGTVERTEPLEVRIKAGTRDGQRIRLAGKGNAGTHGGRPAIFT